MLTATEALDQVQSVAERIRNDETASVGTVSVGDVVRQGDLYLVCITGHEPKKGLRPIVERQLAPGTSQGSRHVLVGECEVFVADDADLIECLHRACPPTKTKLESGRDEALIGPVVKTKGPVELDHPEHGNRVLPAGETFVTVYQRAHAEETRRQQD